MLMVMSASGEPGATPRVKFELRRGAGAEACPSQQDFESKVASRLGYSPFDATAAAQVVVEFSKAGRALRAQLTSTSSSGSVAQRQLEDGDPSCGPLAAAMVLAVAVAVDPHPLLPGPAPEPAPAPEPQPPAPALAAPTPAVAPVATPAAESPTAIAWEFGAGGGVAIGIAPTGVSGAVLLHASGAIGRGSLGLELRLDLPSTRPAGTGSVTSTLVLGTLLPCVGIDRFQVCAQVSAGALGASSSGLVGATSLSAPMVLVGGRVSAAFHLLRWLTVTPWVDVLGALTRVALVVDGAPVWVTPPASGLAGLRLSIPWP